MFQIYRNSQILSEFSRRTGIRDGRVEAIVAGMESPEYTRAQYSGAVTTANTWNPAPVMTMEDLESWWQKIMDMPVRPIRMDVSSNPWWKPKFMEATYSRVNFNFNRDSVDPREWRELYESEFGVKDLLSDDRPIPHED